MKPPKRLFRNRPDREDVLTERTFALAARLMAGFFLEKTELGIDGTREMCRRIATYCMDKPWPKEMGVTLDQAHQESLYATMMRSVEEVLATGKVVRYREADEADALAAGRLANFMLCHTPGPGGGA
jgi:hypothetical protein